jgi:predicted nucleic acid-binding Zn ribbon protein
MTPSLRSRVLSEWRGLPQTPPRPARAIPIAEPLGKVMRALGLNERLTESQILGAWKEVVGDFIASHSCPSRLKEGVLYVQVIQPTVHYELDRVWKPQIVKKLKARFGAKTIRDIKFRVG